jgi:hypothetical protein
MKSILMKRGNSLIPTDDEGADMPDTEIWKPVSGFPKYSVSSLGRVRREQSGPNTKPGKILRTPLDSRGYPMVIFYGHRRRFALKVHRLVAEAFLGPRPSQQHQVAHFDGDRANPKLLNLRWATVKENHADKLRHGTANRGERHGMSRLTIAQVQEAFQRRATGETVVSIATDFGVHRATVGLILRGKSWSWFGEAEKTALLEHAERVR